MAQNTAVSTAKPFTSSDFFQRVSSLASSLVSRNKIPTPFLFFDEGELKRNVERFSSTLPKLNLFYSLKANPHPLLIRYLYQQGLGFEVSSAQEAHTVLAQGIPSNRIILGNPVKDHRALTCLFSNNLFGYPFDNVREIQKIAKFRSEHNYESNPIGFLRVRVDSRDIQVDLGTKFGCDIDDAPKLFAMALEEGLAPGGISFHVGTQSFRGRNYSRSIKECVELSLMLREKHGVEIPYLNIGGGFPDPNWARENGHDLDMLFDELSLACSWAEQKGFKLIAEPGRIMVNTAGFLVTSVIGRSEREGKQWLYLDDGIYGCFSNILYEKVQYSFNAITNNGKPSKPSKASFKSSFVLAGPTCDSLDIVSNGTLLPSSTEVGDFLLSPNIGAYSLSTATGFNGFPLPHAVLVSEDLSTGIATFAIFSGGELIEELRIAA